MLVVQLRVIELSYTEGSNFAAAQIARFSSKRRKEVLSGERQERVTHTLVDIVLNIYLCIASCISYYTSASKYK